MLSEREMQFRPDLGDKMTLGEYRVGISFNPGGNPHVSDIKRRAADLIDYLNDWNSGDNSEAAELVQIAMRKIESAAMDGAKAVTKPAREF
jgi:hypothetical protein